MKPAFGVVVLCRYDSSRYPGKILKNVHGRTVLDHICARLIDYFSVDQLVVATSSETSDDPIAIHCEEKGYKLFRGSKNNVAERFIQAAEFGGFDIAARVNGDNFFALPSLIDDSFSLLLSQSLDFVSNVPERTFPMGMSVEILRIEFLRKCLPLYSELRHKEHVTLWLYENQEVGRRLYCQNEQYPYLKGVNLAFDTPEDLELINYICEQLGDDLKNPSLDHLNTILGRGK